MGLMFALLVLLFFIAACDRAPDEREPAYPALSETFKDAFLIGAALKERHFFGEDTDGLELVRTHFNAITPENDMKWERIHPEPGRYDFEAADAFVDFGEELGMLMTGHVLIWHSQVPDRVFEDEDGNRLDREALLERMRDHIHTIVGRYRGRVQSWEVVNEALNGDGSLRETPWYNIIGEDYLVKAFEYAHEADPDAELFYNDYSLENPEKREGAVRLVRYLQENDVPISAIGTQGHYHIDWPEPAQIEQTIVDFAALGLDVMITELDIDVLPQAMDYMGADVNINVDLREELNPWPDGLPEAMEQELTNRYREIFEVLLRYSDDVSRVTFWGVSDGDSWKNNWPVRGRTNYPLLFDRNHEPKPAFFSVVEAAGEALQP